MSVKLSRNKILFKDLNYGDAFYLNDCYYLYTNAIGREEAYANSRGCAINLLNGLAIYCHDDIEVELVELKANVTQEIIL